MDNRKFTLLMILLIFAMFESPEVIKIPKVIKIPTEVIKIPSEVIKIPKL